MVRDHRRHQDRQRGRHQELPRAGVGRAEDLGVGLGAEVVHQRIADGAAKVEGYVLGGTGKVPSYL